MTDHGDPQLYELSVVRVIQEMTTELAAVKAAAEAQNADLKAFVSKELHDFRQDIYRSVLVLDADIEAIKAAMRRETAERTRRQMEHDARNNAHERRLDRYMYVLVATLALVAAIAGRLWFA